MGTTHNVIPGRLDRGEEIDVVIIFAPALSELGFQQMSQLLPLQGIQIVGELPPGVRRVTAFAAGVPVTSQQPELARALIQWFASPAAYAAMESSGLQPAHTSNRSGKVSPGLLNH